MNKPVYAPIPARAVGDKTLTAEELRVLMALAVHDRLGANGIGCYASHARLSNLVGCHEKSLSRSLAALARRGYIDAGQHPLNKRLRVYKVIYTEFDSLYLAGIGNNPATNDDAIGNNRVGETEPIGNKPNPISQRNQLDQLVNIFSETGIHPVETGKYPAEAEHRAEKGLAPLGRVSEALLRSRMVRGT